MLPQLPMDGSLGNLPVKYWKQYKILTRQGKWKSLGAIAFLDFRNGNGIYTEESNEYSISFCFCCYNASAAGTIPGKHRLRDGVPSWKSAKQATSVSKSAG